MNNDKKPIFTICIPTFNRGKKALNLIETILPYMQNNWEILLLNNNSDNEVEKYNKIEEISNDNKCLRYIKHDVNRQFHGNFLACFEESKSKYIMIVSDEDFPNMNIIQSVIEYIEKNTKVGIFRGSIQPMDGVEAGNSFIMDNQYFQAGEEALLNYGLRNNYHSGTIYNIELLRKNNLINLLKVNLDIHYLYPQLYIELLACSVMDIFIFSDVILYEGSAQVVIEDGARIGDVNNYKFPYSYGSRVDQFVILKDAIYEAVSMVNNIFDIMLFVKLYMNLVKKYFHLISVVNISLYESVNLEKRYILQSFHSFVCSAIVVVPEINDYKEEVIDMINEVYQLNEE